MKVLEESSDSDISLVSGFSSEEQNSAEVVRAACRETGINDDDKSITGV